MYDQDTFSKDLIGLFETDLMELYSRPDHEIHKQWAPLTAPYSERAGILSTAEGGLTGYVKLSMQLVGPDETLKVHDDEDDDEEGGVLLPPAMKREMIFLYARRRRRRRRRF